MRIAAGRSLAYGKGRLCNGRMIILGKDLFSPLKKTNVHTSLAPGRQPGLTSRHGHYLPRTSLNKKTAPVVRSGLL